MSSSVDWSNSIDYYLSFKTKKKAKRKFSALNDSSLKEMRQSVESVINERWQIWLQKKCAGISSVHVFASIYNFLLYTFFVCFMFYIVLTILYILLYPILHRNKLSVIVTRISLKINVLTKYSGFYSVDHLEILQL